MGLGSGHRARLLGDRLDLGKGPRGGAAFAAPCRASAEAIAGKTQWCGGAWSIRRRCRTHLEEQLADTGC
jgi:hypothetical protein